MRPANFRDVSCERWSAARLDGSRRYGFQRGPGEGNSAAAALRETRVSPNGADALSQRFGGAHAPSPSPLEASPTPRPKPAECFLCNVSLPGRRARGPLIYDVRALRLPIDPQRVEAPLAILSV
jgi:hypothetical protein